MKKFPRPHTRQMFKGIVSKLTIKFCQKCGKMKDRQKKKNDYDYKHTGHDDNYKINLAVSF